MKKITINENNLKYEEMTKEVKRAKAIIINDDAQALLMHSETNYYLIGGHVENNETDASCLKREIREEAGIDLTFELEEPILLIEYLCKNYPEGENTHYIANYYVIKSNIKPELDKRQLTEGEIAHNQEIRFIPVNEVIPILTASLDIATNKNVTQDTIEIFKEYLANN